VSIRRPSGPIMKPRKSVVSTLKAHSSTLGYRLFCTKASQNLAYMFEVLVGIVRVDQMSSR
jgi:hypothetical protein